MSDSAGSKQLTTVSPLALAFALSLALDQRGGNQSSLLLGIYYGGSGIGITASALLGVATEMTVAANASGLVGLQHGLVFSAIALWLGAIFASQQRAL